MLKDTYNYPMIFTYSEDEVKIRAVDFEECYSFVEKEKDAVEYAMEILSRTIISYESKKIELPSSTQIFKIELKDNEKLLYLNVWMPYFRGRVKDTYVKKTLTIPSWLDILAKNHNINFSSVLVKALKKELNIEK
ncbi:type II toxin-antitoxin system HicB family antitoxin [Clostridium vincentii]|uniref:HicB-like antitoxin of toxin-antitoxin system domain-containing protein n=1 Tax=Clostridium vincentii TaxID=52704 RepID=A0A2T0BET3_9CLOT|nr:type II toxin-antitoxin system HicB family antitoxin [Clostridium vincentii]PRR82342.1 hypothetical protein CLVI_18480 [Clostridium vincentii]